MLNFKKKEFFTYSNKQTIKLGKKIGNLIYKGCIISLIGNLGSGKTTFIKGIAKSLNINDTINSPTFVLLKTYVGRLKLNHIDAFRLKNIDNFYNIYNIFDFNDLINEKSLLVIEWGNFLKKKKNVNLNFDILIYFKYLNKNSRKIIIENKL